MRKQVKKEQLGKVRGDQGEQVIECWLHLSGE